MHEECKLIYSNSFMSIILQKGISVHSKVLSAQSKVFNKVQVLYNREALIYRMKNNFFLINPMYLKEERH